MFCNINWMSQKMKCKIIIVLLCCANQKMNSTENECYENEVFINRVNDADYSWTLFWFITQLRKINKLFDNV